MIATYQFTIAVYTGYCDIEYLAQIRPSNNYFQTINI